MKRIAAHWQIIIALVASVIVGTFLKQFGDASWVATTVNMDGTALYECIAVMFVAQVMGMQMDFAAQMLIVISALLTSIGVAGVPSASMVAILIIMNNCGIPGAQNAIYALFIVDRLLDMTRTAVNVFGDSCAAVVIAKSEGEELYQTNKSVF